MPATAALLALSLVTVPIVDARQPPERTPARITVIVDAFGARPGLAHDWGYAALVEYGGKRILFDTGNNAGIFARNAKKLGVDLTRLDAAVMGSGGGLAALTARRLAAARIRRRSP